MTGQHNDPFEPINTPEKEKQAGFEQLKRKNKRKRIKRGMTYAALMVALIAVFLLIAVTVFFKVGTIRVKGSDYYGEQDIIDASGIEYRQNLYSIDEEEVAANIKSSFPFVRSVRITRNVPTTVVITVKCDNPAYYVEVGSESYLIADSLRVLSRAPDAETLIEKYPGIKKLKVARIERSVVGEKMTFGSEMYTASLEGFLSVLSQSRVFPGVTCVDMSDRFNISVTYEKRLKALLGTQTDMNVKLLFLCGIIDDLGNSSGTVDVKDAEVGYVVLSAAEELE